MLTRAAIYVLSLMLTASAATWVQIVDKTHVSIINWNKEAGDRLNLSPLFTVVACTVMLRLLTLHKSVLVLRYKQQEAKQQISESVGKSLVSHPVQVTRREAPLTVLLSQL